MSFLDDVASDTDFRSLERRVKALESMCLKPPAPPSPPAFDEASWRAGAEAMRAAILKRLQRHDAPFHGAGYLARCTDLPPLPRPFPEMA